MRLCNLLRGGTTTKTTNLPKCGAADSKYFSNPQQFDTDIAKNDFDSALFKAKVKQLILENPSKLKLRYNQMIEVAMEVKREFGISERKVEQ